MADEVNFDELEGLMTLGSALPEASVAPAVSAAAGGEDGAAAPATSDDAAARKQERRRRKKEKKEKKERKEKKDRKKEKAAKRHRTEEGGSAGGDDDSPADDSVDEEEEDDRKQSKYVIDAADSTDGDDDFIGDDEDDGTEEGYDEGPRFDDGRDATKGYIFHKGDDQKSADALGREYEERVRMMRHQRGAGGADDHVGGGRAGAGGAGLSARRYTSRMMPNENDPKVFAVRVQPRKQRLLVARVVNKCYCHRMGKSQERVKHDLGIISVFAIDRVKEYIYVEAWRKEFVQRALSGLVGVMLYDISVVEPTELLQMLERRPSNEKIPIGGFVRMRQRFYKADLAQVTAVHQDGVHITVKVVPREDFVDKPYNKTTTKLPPRFFAASRAVGVEDRDDHYRWGDLRFDKNGYLLKTVSARMLISGAQMEKPTTEELARFFHHNRERVREAIQRSGEEALTLHIGDSVRVISGQLRDTVGTLTNVYENDKTATLSCKIPGRKDPVNLRVEVSACAKHFAEGVHVIVERGTHVGESGTVVKSHGDTVTLFPDRQGASSELTVRANDCHQSKLVGTVSHSHGTWQLYDLVTLVDANTVACITGLANGGMMVLTERNETNTLTYAEVKAVPRGQRQTADPLQNIVTRGCEVVLQRTPLTPINLAGQTGRVEQVFNRVIFVSFRSIYTNAGLVAVDASCVLLLGGRTTTRQSAPPKTLPAPHRRPHNATHAELSVRADSMDWQNNSEWYEPPSMPQ